MNGAKSEIVSRYESRREKKLVSERERLRGRIMGVGS